MMLSLIPVILTVVAYANHRLVELDNVAFPSMSAEYYIVCCLGRVIPRREHNATKAKRLANGRTTLGTSHSM